MENVISTSQQLVMSWNHDLGSLRIAFLSHRSARHSTTAQGPGERSGEASSAATIHRGSTPWTLHTPEHFPQTLEESPYLSDSSPISFVG
jgi:hypothetical protein